MEVYDAECIGIMKAAETCLRIATQEQREGIICWIFTDNQAAVHRVPSLQPGPRQDVAIAIASIATQLQDRDISLQIQWVPGHLHVPGNEHSDQLAKAATKEKQAFHFDTSISHVRRAAKARIIREWRTKWEEMPNKGKNYSGTFRQRPDEIFRTNNRQLISTVTQLRTGVGILRAISSTYPTTPATTPCATATGGYKQEVRHLLTTCPLLAEERAVMTKDAGQILRKMKLQTLLYTNLGAKPLQTFLKTTGIATCRWILGLQLWNRDVSITSPRARKGVTVCS
jgi:ribonuclease HI